MGYLARMTYQQKKHYSTDDLTDIRAALSNVLGKLSPGPHQSRGPSYGVYDYIASHRCRVIDYERMPEDNFTCVSLKVYKAPYICVYNDTKDDEVVSHEIKSGGVWEKYLMNKVANVLKQDPNLALIDIGSNIGQFSLLAASMGRKVIAVEALKKHALMLGRAVVMNGFQNQVKIVNNAMSNTYRNVTLVKFRGDPGKTRMETNDIGAVPVQEKVPTILMDDLVHVVDFRTAIMKIDIEGQEIPALSHSIHLFTKVDIPVVFMEWWGSIYNKYKTKEENAMVTTIFTFFKTHGYQVYDANNNVLDVEKWNEWPIEVIWAKNKLST